jgi:hypothetical protein
MGTELPHWVIKGHEAVSAVNKSGEFIDENKQVVAGGEKWRELNVNDTAEWLQKYGQENGWRQVEAAVAQQMANEGHPAIALWKNPNTEKPGHIAMIRPGSVPLKTDGVAVAQAGRLVLDAGHLKEGFNDRALPKAVQYWWHQ